MARGSGESSPVAPLLLLLAIVGGGGGWNYHQNLEAEKQEYRPYRGYTDEDLVTLQQTFSGQTDLRNDRYKKTITKPANARTMSYFAEQIREFERVQNIAREKRDARDRLADMQATLELVEKEQQRRARERDALKLFLKRAFTINR